MYDLINEFFEWIFFKSIDKSGHNCRNNNSTLISGKIALKRNIIEKFSWLIIPLFIIHRLWIVFAGRCLIDSDEAIIGIMGLDALRGQFHSFFYGQDYMGSFQSLAAVSFIILFGATPLALRITAIAEGIGVLLCWRWILKKWNLFSVWIIFGLLFAIAPEFIITWTLKSRGGYIETLFLGSLWLTLLVKISLSSQSFDKDKLWWFCLGLLTGIGWWTCQLIVFFFIPGIAYFLFIAENRKRLMDFGINNKYKFVHIVIFLFYWLSLALVMARGTIYYLSPLSKILYDYRWIVLVLHLIAVLFVFILCRMKGRLLWYLTFGFGIIIGYLPALFVVLTKENLYNTTVIESIGNLFLNLSSFIMISGGSIIGLLDGRLNPLGLPIYFLIIVPVIYLLSVVLILIDLIKKIHQERKIPSVEGFLVFSLVVLLILVCLVQKDYSNAPPYALFWVFFLNLTLAWFLAKQWSISWVASLVMLFIIIFVNLYSIAKIPQAPVNYSNMVTKSDQEVIDFLVNKNINVACTSLKGASHGYWEAYRLTFASGERLIVHPILHMPRISRYREMLKKSKHCAIITTVPKWTESVFNENGIRFRKNIFGNLTVFWDFDKKQVDQLGLISYKESL